MNTTEGGTARTLGEVLEQLNGIIARAVAERSRLAFFATLYRGVTAQIQTAIQAGRFEDGPRMERLDVIFANRYLGALNQFRHGEPPTQSWRVAFDTAARWRPLILQHLLLGMNAHINLDLGIAAAQTSPGPELAALRPDFEIINDLLTALVPLVMRQVGQLSPWIGLLDRIDPKAEVALLNFSIVKARAQAWELAQKLAPLHPGEWAPKLAEVDALTSALADLIANPVGLLFNAGLRVIRLRETNDIPTIVQSLEKVPLPQVSTCR